jgi:hypothetical protein
MQLYELNTEVGKEILLEQNITNNLLASESHWHAARNTNTFLILHYLNSNIFKLLLESKLPTYLNLAKSVVLFWFLFRQDIATSALFSRS